MKYQAVFWDIDGVLYDNSGDIPEGERGILSPFTRLEPVPQRELRFWVPYNGLVELMSRIPSEFQGVISNGHDQLQRDKLLLLGLIELINPNLVFTSYGEAEIILNTPNHPLLEGFRFQGHNTDIEKLTSKTQKPEAYMFERALEAIGFPAEGCVMIGDEWTDIFGAQRVGMKSIYISGVNTPKFEDPIAEGIVKPDYTVNKGNIKALTDLLI